MMGEENRKNKPVVGGQFPDKEKENTLQKDGITGVQGALTGWGAPASWGPQAGWKPPAGWGAPVGWAGGQLAGWKG